MGPPGNGDIINIDSKFSSVHTIMYNPKSFNAIAHKKYRPLPENT
jgi:hypothetical protein